MGELYFSPLRLSLLANQQMERVSRTKEYGDAACANPPQGDPLTTAIWLGQLIGQVATLTSVAAPAAQAAP